jgi:hypothetical protein
MIFGVSPTKDAVVIALATGSGKTFVIKSIRSIQFQARSGDGLNELFQRLVVIFDLSGTSRGSTIALLGSSSGRFKSSVEAIKGEAITELAAAKSGLPVVRVTAASLKKVLGCAPGQKWQARAEERFNPRNSRKNWSHGAVGAAAAAFKVAAGLVSTAKWCNGPPRHKICHEAFAVYAWILPDRTWRWALYGIEEILPFS